MKPALYAATATKPVQAATVNKSLQFRRLLRDFFAPVWGLPLDAVYVPVHDKIRSESFAVAANISRRSGGALKALIVNHIVNKYYRTPVSSPRTQALNVKSRLMLLEASYLRTYNTNHSSPTSIQTPTKTNYTVHSQLR